MIIKNCSVEGIERIEGKRKTDGKPFAFWKLHLTTSFPVYGGEPSGEGNKVLTCNVDDKTFHENQISIGCEVDVYSRGQYTDFIDVSA